MEAQEVASQLLKAAMMPRSHHNGTRPGDEGPNIPFGTVEFWIVFCCCLCLVGFAALMSGLTMAYMSIDPLNLGILQASGSLQDQTYAAAIAPLLAHRHLLLVTLLVGNASAMEALPIFLDKLVPSWVAIILSVTLVLIFGEIIPQAVFTKYRLPIGASMAIFTRSLEFLTSPICWPIATLLDFVLGKDHPTVYRRCELKELTKMHAITPSGHGTLSAEEVRMMVGTLELGDKKVQDAMQPFQEIFMISMNQVLDADMMSRLYSRGHSRIPVYDNDRTNDICGFVLVRNLILVSAEDKVTLKEVAGLCVKPITRVRPSLPLFEMLRHFKQRKTQIAIVVEDGEGEGAHPVVGLITMEDVLEEILQEEIEDETDGEAVGNVMHRIAETYLHRKTMGTRLRRRSLDMASRSKQELSRGMSDRKVSYGRQMRDLGGKKGLAGGVSWSLSPEKKEAEKKAGASQEKRSTNLGLMERVRGARSEGSLGGTVPLLGLEEGGRVGGEEAEAGARVGRGRGAAGAGSEFDKV